MDLTSKKFHFIAIGGVGMSAIAKYLLERGAKVSGSDIESSKYTDLLKKIGINITIGHNKDLIQKDMIVIASSAIKETNPEIVKAKELGLKIYHRSDILKMISDEFSKRDDSYFIGFSGTHGKTTTSGLCSYILNKGGYNPSFIIGGIIPEININGLYNGSKYFIAELDESDGTIQKYSTDIAVINNMEKDHLDYYKNGFPDIANTFNKYLLNKPNQKVIINIDNEGNKKFIELYKNFNYITFGINNAKYNAKNIKFMGLNSKYDLYINNNFQTEIELSIPGMHNIYNSLAVAAALTESGIEIKDVNKYFKTFTGMGRRFQKVGEFNNITIYDDYAHHPSEIKTTLKAIKSAVQNENRLVVVFQPHRYSRLQGLWSEFKTVFNDVDKLFVTDVYSAGEKEIENINSKKFCDELNNFDCEYIEGDMNEAAIKILPKLKANDIVITLGAGTITKLGNCIIKEYQRK